MSRHGIIGLIFVDGTATTQQFLKVLENNFILMIKSDPDFDKIWLMQDGVRLHRTKKVFEVLEEYFGDCILALRYREANGMGLARPPYSPYLNICDLFLWCKIKGNVYKNNPKTISEHENYHIGGPLQH